MRWLVAVSLVLVALAGCSDAKDDPVAQATSSSASSTTAATPLPNLPPTATVIAAVNGTEAAFTLNGTDPDGDNVTWTLHFGDNTTAANGTTLPASVNHTYAAPGNYSANLTVSDGNLTNSYTVNVTAVSSAVAVSFTGHVLAPSPAYNTEGECLEIILQSPFGRSDFGAEFPVDAGTWGWAYAFDVAGMVAIFYTEGFVDNLEEGSAGTVPDGAATVLACSESAVDSDYTLTLTPP